MKLHSISLILILSLLLCTTIGCSSAPDTDLLMEIAELNVRVENLEDEIDALKESMAAPQVAAQAAPEASAAPAGSASVSESASKSEVPASTPNTAQSSSAVTAASGELTDIAAQVVSDYQSSKRYAEIAYDVSTIKVIDAIEYRANEIENFSVHMIFLTLDVDQDMHGITSGMILIDLNSMQTYDETMLDVNNLMYPIETYDQLLPWLLNCYGSWYKGINEVLYADMEIITALDTNAINAMIG